MRSCPPGLVTSATHQVLWKDSEDVVNVAHYGPSRLGPVLPVVARETVLVSRRSLAEDPDVRAAGAKLTAAQRATMAATTRDHDLQPRPQDHRAGPGPARLPRPSGA
jgi:hypothetical protein